MKKKNVSKKQAIDPVKFAKTLKFLKIVSDENRLKILLTLKGGSMNVTEIHNSLKLPQNLTSHHISKLKGIGLLSEKREGTFRQYGINGKRMKELSGVFKSLLGL